MSSYALDTLTQAENLQQSGFSEIQAKGLVQVISLSTHNLATKQDLEQTKLEMRMEIQQECNILRREVSEFKQEIHQEFFEFKQETRLEFSRIREDLGKLDGKILKMTVSLGGVMVTSLGVYTYLLQLIA